MPDYFDVKTLPPYTQDCIATRSINLMCAILRGITYRELYTHDFHDDSGNSVLDRMLYNINNLHPDLQVGATTNSRIVIPILAGPNGAFTRIHALLSLPGMPRIKLGKLYHEKRVHPTTDMEKTLRNFIVDTLDGVHTATNDQMFHFCVPFISIQMGTRPTRPSETEFNRFISVLGKKTLQEFYNASYTMAEKERAIIARKQGILREKRPDSSRPPRTVVKVTNGNGYVCINNQSCCLTEDENNWCNTVIVSGGTMCALGSDHGVPEDCVTQTTKKTTRKAATKKPAAGKRKASTKK